MMMSTFRYKLPLVKKKLLDAKEKRRKGTKLRTSYNTNIKRIFRMLWDKKEQNGQHHLNIGLAWRLCYFVTEALRVMMCDKLGVSAVSSSDPTKFKDFRGILLHWVHRASTRFECELFLLVLKADFVTQNFHLY